MASNEYLSEPRRRYAPLGRHIVISVAALAFLVCVCAVLLSMFGLTGAERAAASPNTSGAPQLFRTSRPVNEATASPSFETPASETPAVSQTPELEPSGYVKTAVYVDGEKRIVLASLQAAQELISSAVSHFERIETGFGAVTTVENEIDFRAADEADAAVSFDEAYSVFTGASSPLRVVTKFARNTVTLVPNGTLQTESADFYVGTRFVSTCGRSGKKLQVFEYTYINGVQAETTLSEERVLLEPVDEIVVIGVRPVPEFDTAGPEFGLDDCPETSLGFSAPVSAEITRYFGFIDGTLHRGLDYAVSSGMECRVACSGTVAAVFERGSLGLTVDIDHGAGFITRYALLGSASVKPGDSVRAGDVLGLAAGDELHFEIIAGGRPQNPLFYLR